MVGVSSLYIAQISEKPAKRCIPQRNCETQRKQLQHSANQLSSHTAARFRISKEFYIKFKF